MLDWVEHKKRFITSGQHYIEVWGNVLPPYHKHLVAAVTISSLSIAK